MRKQKKLTVMIVTPYIMEGYGLRQSLIELGINTEFESNADVAFKRIVDNSYGGLICDVELGQRGGLCLIDDVISRAPECRVILFSRYITDVVIMYALQAGVTAIVDNEDYNALTGICQALRGKPYFSVSVQKRLSFDNKGKPIATIESLLQTLTLRQIAVLRHLVSGSTCKQTAKILKLSSRAVESHKYRIMKSLGINDRVELARYAIREGLIPA